MIWVPRTFKKQFSAYLVARYWLAAKSFSPLRYKISHLWRLLIIEALPQQRGQSGIELLSL